MIYLACMGTTDRDREVQAIRDAVRAAAGENEHAGLDVIWVHTPREFRRGDKGSFGSRLRELVDEGELTKDPAGGQRFGLA